ncbi:hypothetical protein [Bacillus sp. JJ1764]|uniref:hypothetical protein n=1 Tax=Bacillus sp. JJ1764 TaxID=3122964 RepID=UPI0030004B77
MTTTITTGIHGATYSGTPLPMFGTWNQVIHHHPYSVHVGHNVYYMVPILYGHPPAFPYLGPYVPFRYTL